MSKSILNSVDRTYYNKLTRYKSRVLKKLSKTESGTRGVCKVGKEPNI